MFSSERKTVAQKNFCCLLLDHNYKRTVSVDCLRGEGEELYTGMGIGTDGFPGLTDEFEREIPDWGFDTEHIAQKYLEQCQLMPESLCGRKIYLSVTC